MNEKPYNDNGNGPADKKIQYQAGDSEKRTTVVKYMNKGKIDHNEAKDYAKHPSFLDRIFMWVMHPLPFYNHRNFKLPDDSPHIPEENANNSLIRKTACFCEIKKNDNFAQRMFIELHKSNIQIKPEIAH